MKEIGANLLLAEHIGRAHVVGGEPADCLDVRRPGSSQQNRQAACRRSYADATGSWSFSVRVQTPGDSVPAPEQIHQPAALNDSTPYGEAVQSNQRNRIGSETRLQTATRRSAIGRATRLAFAATGIAR